MEAMTFVALAMEAVARIKESHWYKANFGGERKRLDLVA
jgi:hypothetical protein